MRRISFVFVLLGLVGCYASEKMGKDIQDTSHDVNQGGIYMHKGALGVYRPEPPAPQLTNASLTKAPAAKPAPAPAPAPAAPKAAAAATQWPAAPPVTNAPTTNAPAPSPTPPPPNASDASVTEPGSFSL